MMNGACTQERRLDFGAEDEKEQSTGSNIAFNHQVVPLAYFESIKDQHCIPAPPSLQMLSREFGARSDLQLKSPLLYPGHL